MDENKVEATTISKYDYYTDEVGRRTFVAHEGSAFDCVGAHHWQFLYNARNELTHANRITGVTQGQGDAMTAGDYDYTYDPIGNRIDSSGEGRQTTYTPNDVNQYLNTSDPAESFGYDTDGNLTADGTYKYVWDGENRLIEIVTKRTDDEYQPGDKRLRFRYDYMSRRVEKVFSVYKATGWSERKRQRYVYDGWNVVLVLDGGNNVKTSYTWGLDLSGSLQGAGSVGGLLAEFKMNGQYPEAHWFTYDGNGNVAQVLRNYSTVVTVAAHYEYDPYGNTLASPGDYADANPFRFSTKWLDSELASWSSNGAIGNTGLYYYGYRYYSPRLGRWVNRDPAEELRGLSLYCFVDNDSINSVDYLGLVKIYYDSKGNEVDRTQCWWIFSTTKYIQGPKGNVIHKGIKYWEVWGYDNDSLPGKFSGVINENWDGSMRSFVNSQKNLNFTAPSWYKWYYPSWLKSTDLVMHMSPHNRPWDYKQFLSSNEWYIYNKKAYRYDSIGNITWGAIMKSYGWPEEVSKIGGGLYQIYSDWKSGNLSPWELIKSLQSGAYGDEPRDQQAIHEGYDSGF